MLDAPGFVDLQVNGYGGVDFNADKLSVTDLRRACQYLRDDGVAGVLATVITDDVPRMQSRLARIAAAREEDALIAEVILGLHIEGPFLNPQPGFIGAHPTEFARPASIDVTKRLIEVGQGLVRIVTLAPECDPDFRLTKWLADQNIVVSAGHCDPDREQLRAAISAGLSMFTHLGNGCPLQMHRHDNIIQRVLSLSNELAIGFIADGTHVPFVALRNYLRCAGLQRAFIVTDAISAAGQGPGKYEIAGREVIVDDTLATWVPDRSHLVGSAVTMSRAKENLTKELGYSETDVQVLTRHNPLRAIGLVGRS